MRFASVANGQPDGRLHLVSRDHHRAVPAAAVTTLQAALDDWCRLAADLQREATALEQGPVAGEVPLAQLHLLAPLPRAWQWLDASAFPSHGELMHQAFGFAATHPEGKPLMYQGISDRFLGPEEPVPFGDLRDDIDFEGEFGVICDAIPQGADAARCREHIRLLVQINDWSLRRLGPVEMKSGFGMLQCKPRCSMAPVAVTPDELGERWQRCRIDLPLEVRLNGEVFGRARGGAMAYGFDELLAHAAYSRDLVAGTVLGSGTVANPEWREVGSSCLSERRSIEVIEQGRPLTPYLTFGDRVRMEARDAQGAPLFGALDQEVVALDARR
ncbi:fumarylacetoacetate hydrolase family protein [uncultured Pseudomonas sp.]|uniref:fumarylacetoacetate hydrolase family protein n=1 Tax=uncultured Pseudomonas sp. TaxID=114707 RepID=UPI0025F82C56|nr:fumarylacetoacetate hydrolase family protein [uncultured Pseudomonas sp.]